MSYTKQNIFSIMQHITARTVIEKPHGKYIHFKAGEELISMY